MALKTDYKDDVPVSERRKYQMVDNGDGTVSFVDVTEYSQEGDTFGAADINATNEAVNGKLDGSSMVDPMLATEEGFPADAKLTRDAIDELNSNFRNLIGFPDYANKIQISNNYTATENGFISIHAASSDTSSADRNYKVFINDTLVYQLCYGLAATTWWYGDHSLFPVKKGDVIKLEVVKNVTLEGYFLPCRY